MVRNKQTKKQNLIIAIVLIVSVLVIGFIIKNRIASIPDYIESEQTTNPPTSSVETLGLATVFVYGEIDSVSEGTLVLKDGENEIPLTISKGVAIYKKDDSQVQTLSIKDLKTKRQVQVEINQANSEVIGIEMVQ